MKIKTLVISAIIGLTATCAAAAEKEISRDESLFTLQRAIDTAVTNNLSLKQAQIEKDISISKHQETRAAKGFTLDASANYTEVFNTSISTYSVEPILNPVYNPAQPISPTNNPTLSSIYGNTVLGVTDYTSIGIDKTFKRDLSFTIAKPVYTFGKIENGIRMARIGISISDLDIQSTILEIDYKVKEAYYQHLLAIENLEVQKEAVKQSQAHYEIANYKFQYGTAPKIEVIKSDSDLASAKQSLSTAEKAVDLSRLALCNAMGIDIDTPIRVVVPDDVAKDNIDSIKVDQLIAIAFAKRPEIRKVELGEDVQSLLAKVNRLTPTIGMGANYSPYSKNGTLSQDSWAVAVQASIPIYDSGSARAKTRQAQQSREKLAKTQIQLRDGITLQVNSAYLSLREAAIRKTTSKATLDLTEEALRMSEVGFKEGTVTNIDVLDAQHNVNYAKLGVVQAKYDYELAKAALINSLGLTDIAQLIAMVK